MCKNEDIKVIAVPVGVGNDIDENPTFDEVIKSTNIQILTVGTTFRKLNDEELTEMYWFFLADMNKKQFIGDII